MNTRIIRIHWGLISLLAMGWFAGTATASDFFLVQVVGDFNEWNPYGPAMTPISATQWGDTLNVPAGCTLLKFRTDFSWDSPPDYGRCSGSEGPCQILVPQDSMDPLVEETCLVTGQNAIGEVEFPVTGSYEFILDEGSGTFSIRYLGPPLPMGSISGTVAFADNPPVPPLAAAIAMQSGTENLAGWVEADPIDGSFAILDLPSGSYDLWIGSGGYEDAFFQGVTVDAPHDTDLGTITLVPASTITMMQVLGDFNQWDVLAPPMSHPESTVWVDTLAVEAGCSFIKFLTNGVWGEDYGRCSGSEGPCQSPVPDDGALVLDACIVSGTGNAFGQVEFPESTDYVFIVDEGTGTCTIHKANVVEVDRLTWGNIKALYR